MTNKEKFIQVMNKTFDAGFSEENLEAVCSPCGALKRRELACAEWQKKYGCAGCVRWWNEEYVPPKGDV